MARKKSKATAIEEMLSSSVASQWCVVDIDNNFIFNGFGYSINDKVKQYIVLNKPARKENGQWNDWTNESQMTQVLCIDTSEEIRFYDENLSEISSEDVKIKL